MRESEFFVSDNAYYVNSALNASYPRKLGVGDLRRIREAYEEIVPEMQKRKAEILQHERRLSDLVNEAYGLTPEEVDLMWKTAPPRMPVGR